MGDQGREIELQIPRTRTGLSYFPSFIEPRRRCEQAIVVINAARTAGLSDAHLGDIVGHVAANVLTSYFNTTFEVDIDFPVVAPREPAIVA